MNGLSIVILAAGKGTRMRSDIPKVLHQLAGKTLIDHVIDTCKSLASQAIYVIYGHDGEKIKEALASQPIKLVEQTAILGTGHAVLQVKPFIRDDENILILYGDAPLITAETLEKLIQKKNENNAIILLTANVDDPNGYGRILRERNGRVCGIIEQKDANDEQRKMTEINSGILLADGKKLKKWLSKLTNNNAQQEYYLTDIIGLAYQDNELIETVHPSDNQEIEGINDRLQLAQLERVYQRREAKKLLQNGLTLRDLNRFDLRGELRFGKDVIIDSNVIIEGKVVLGDRVKIETGCVLKSCTIGDDCVISPFSVIENSVLHANCTIGPYARLRPGNILHDNVHIGNFVEVKNSQIAQGTKAGHLSYLGDAQIGQNVNIGAGTITCNYDGANKHKTIIGDDVFVGSDTQLVAPVSVANGATIGAGTTVTDDILGPDLVISRVRQKEIANWKRPTKNKK